MRHVNILKYLHFAILPLKIIFSVEKKLFIFMTKKSFQFWKGEVTVEIVNEKSVNKKGLVFYFSL